MPGFGWSHGWSWKWGLEDLEIKKFWGWVGVVKILGDFKVGVAMGVGVGWGCN